ncbi:hypothetical protein FB45DRAFT_1102637 [Roridomyces roridus]|uniref:Uncharacterized protein n=1 Tax=Roridomyces roridus TaxID=1738132 RepID=A0AAD7CGH7_9AGAR|nr:hypothetical protein FB45DRAFT_1102637 [Roridomyces roridus]
MRRSTRRHYTTSFTLYAPSSMAQNTQYRDILRKVSGAPRRFISAARQQNLQGLAALTDLVNVWAHVPRILDHGIIDMFLSHLRQELAPASTREWRNDATFAQLSLRALSGMPRFFDAPKYAEQARMLLAGWPGIVTWSHYIYDFHHANSTGAQQRVRISSIAGLLYELAGFPTFHPCMVDTPGSVELVTKLWIWGFNRKVNIAATTFS